MSWAPNEKEIQSVSSLSAPKRYEHWLKKVADNEELWSLTDRGNWALMRDDEGKELVPVWPHRAYALNCASGEWEGYEPRTISLDTWLQRWIPGMKRDGRLVAVFPVSNGKGVSVDPERLRADLENELAQYE